MRMHEERRRTFILYTAQDHRKKFSRLMSISATSLLWSFVYKFVLHLFYLLLYFSLAGQSSGQFKESVSVVLPVVRMENDN